MKNSLSTVIFVVMLSLATGVFSQGVAISADPNTTPDPSAALDITSNSKGVLIPRMTESQRTMIASPATGLLVYQTDGADGFYFYNGNVWQHLSSDTPSELEKVSEGGKTGWRILGRDPQNHGNIGEQAVDLVHGTLATGGYGALGNHSFAVGRNSGAGGTASIAMGESAFAGGTGSVAISGGEAQGDHSFAMGPTAYSYGNYSFTQGYEVEAAYGSQAFGAENRADGHHSTVFGLGNESRGYGNMTIGIWNDPILPENEVQTAPTPATPLFIIGNGELDNRSNAMVVRKDGKVGIGTSVPDPSAIVDIQSTSAGFLTPRMTQAQRDAIQNPATSVLIYQTDGEPGFYYNADTPATPNWQLVGSNAGVFSQWTTNGSDIHYSDGNVGIGTDNPISLLSVNAGINVDQSNSNGFASLASALTFGNNKQVGIASNRSNNGNVQKGMDLYTGGVRRISIDSIGNVGIGTTFPQYRLDVSGTARFNNILYASYRLGIGVSNPDYPLHTSTGYFSTRVGIGTIPNNTYALDLAGSSRFQGNMRVTGNVISENNVVVQNNRGIVRSNTGTQYKIVPFTLTFSINAGPGGEIVTGNVSYGETFSAPPIVIVGSFTSATGTAGNVAWLNIIPWGSGNSGTTFYIANVGNGTATFSTVTVRCLAIGPQ